MERDNTGREKELDIARGLAAVFMVLIHTAGFYWDGQNAVFYNAVNFLGSPPCAPVFMFLLGAGVVYSRKSTAEKLLRRGLTLFGLSYVFNALAFALPDCRSHEQ